MAASAIPPLLLLSLLPFLPFLAASNVTLGSSLSTASDSLSWVSPSGDFAFGFRQLSNTNIFLLAIWYAQIPDQTIVWHANTTSPVQAGSNIELTVNGLNLTDPNGMTIWGTAQPNSTISYGAMLDTGNFILSGTNTSVYVWQSFNYPTDTILPTQVLPLGGMLYSKLSATNYTKGRFELHFTNGDLKLNPIAWPNEYQYNDYYNSGTGNANSSLPGIQLVFNQSGDVYILLGNGTNFEFWSYTFPISSNYYRATLDFDGVFREYAYAVSNQSWSVVGYIPENICFDLYNQFVGSGACGFNSYCSADGATTSCQCPPGFSYTDPNNENGGCAPDFPPNCEGDNGTSNLEDLYDMTEKSNINFPSGDYDVLGPFNSTQCGQACLHDCNCVVAISNGTYCWKKRLPMSNGRQEGSYAFFKMRKGTVPPPGASSSNSKQDKKVLWLSVLFGSSGLFNILLLGVISLVVISRRQRTSSKDMHDSSAFETNLRVFTFEELKKATEGFKEELGRGSFGIVYKGVLKYGSETQVAVKKLDNLSQDGDREFKAEVNAIGRTHHKNLVRLLGYCFEGPQRLLVYEFMSNGSLPNFLFDNPRPDWCKRVQVALGIARGLVYLHEECSAPIIHCDIKPQNILIDRRFIPRISDFGLAKSLELNQTRTHTGVRGTRGYVAPEWFRNVPVTVKVDVYSFGVMLLEIICCRKSVAKEFEYEERAILTDWASVCLREGTLDALVDNDEAAMNDIETLRRWVMTAIWCIEEDPLQRPAMDMVIQMLEGYVEVPIPI